jgi:hypothetical protein
MAFPFYGADGTSGTVAVSNGSKNVTGTGTNWLSNNAVPTAGGYAIKMPDGQIYGIDACTGEGALHLVENYNGSTVSGGTYYIMPVAAAIGKLLNDVSTLLNSSNFSQLAGLSPNSGDYVQYVAGTWATRTALQALLSLLNSMSEVNIASASTCDIGASTSPKVQITGTTTITGLGTQTNAFRVVRFGGALTLTHNASSLILPASANIATASGDTCFALSDSSGNWRIFGYQRANGIPICFSGLTGSGNAVGSAAPTLTGTTVAASLALGGATIGTDKLAITGTASISGGAFFPSGNGVQWGPSTYMVGDTSVNSITAKANNSGGVTLTSGATSWAAVSDEDTKTDLIPISNPMQKIASLRAMTGRYKVDDLGVSRAFLIAQDVRAVLPEAVSEGNDGILSLRYSDVIPLLVAGLKEANDRLAALESVHG